ncbi:AmpG family muropeptide MFS transporter [Belnapia rosea]|uniref:MFS transporter, PAT family, beta-lactamase induction signal transducer AmpG n=1 Tax=Belnapia rosea TaxID=938405 RepID=A0A1G6W5L9_9PROT|nr:MFS transporter [Belnapia rosea]SDB31018.1 MFS transporter, PAT family, beta-lactamase induction signal transducer AmpG [Belnapia rosea]SDD61088.1 MFS transporter, PAT family, beta-lactamase induction signal transducer AmpG [Belnapia rosea]
MSSSALSGPASWWRDRRYLVLLALGFASGIPLPLTAATLRRWLSEEGLSVEVIGLTASLGLAYTLKFLWAPALDQVPPPLFRWLGRRRGWLLCIQPALIAAIAALGLTTPSATAYATTFALAGLVAFLSASQDVVVDAYRIDLLEEREQGYGLALYVWGYRGALLASGAGALAVTELGGWALGYGICALLLGIGLLAVLLGPEPAAPPRLPATPAGRLRAALVDPFLDFMRRRHWLAILLFVVLFKLGEALAGVMTQPFYAALGFTRLELAAINNVFGLLAILGGALAGGWLIRRLGIARALVLTGFGQMLSNLMYVAVAQAGHNIPLLWAQVGIENFTDGMADAAFLAYLSGLTNRAFSATQYALLSSLAAFASRTLGAGSGFLARWLDWTGFFLMTTLAALPAMAIMLWLLRRLPPQPRQAEAAAVLSNP